jgi:hypothetical protein
MEKSDNAPFRHSHPATPDNQIRTSILGIDTETIKIVTKAIRSLE